VTRLGEFSPSGQLATLGSIWSWQNYPYFWVTFSHGKGSVLILTKIRRAAFLGDFFHKLVWSPWKTTKTVRRGKHWKYSEWSMRNRSFDSTGVGDRCYDF
jgi:hypothetical protein